MRTPPSPNECLRYPITTFVAVVAQSSAGKDINPIFLCGAGDPLREPWRLLTSALFHLGPFHLVFNLYWLWVFGTLVEERFGHGATLGIYCLFAAAPNAAELAMFQSCVGLSGVGYGLFGMLWVLSRCDARFRNAVDRQTVQLMVGWFFLCILMTITDVLRVGNVAHGAGCALGALLGWTISAHDVSRRLGRGAILTAICLTCIVSGASVRHFRFNKEVAYDSACRAYQALENGDNEQAVLLSKKSIAIDPNRYGTWQNLGVAYYRLGRADEAREAFERAASLKPQDIDRERSVE
jgi:membrane associated rhomboid family serine protease